jgi:hypothetical protein
MMNNLPCDIAHACAQAARRCTLARNWRRDKPQPIRRKPLVIVSCPRLAPLLLLKLA